MKFEKIHNKGQATLFENPVLESLTKAHPLLIWGIYLPIVISLLYYSIEYNNIVSSRILASFGVGVVAWTLFEYLIHRFAFHFTPKTERSTKISTLKIIIELYDNLMTSLIKCAGLRGKQ